MFRGTTIRAMLMGFTVLAVTCAGIDDAQAKKPNKAKADIVNGRKIVIVHTNDVHGNLEPDSKGRGGLTRIATLLKEIRKENPNAVIYLDAGDDAQGTPVSNLFHGEPMFKALSIMQPAAGTIGNHEYDWGLAAQKEMYKNAKYPILAANVVNKFGKHIHTPYLITEVNGVKIGILGLITEEIPSLVKKGKTEDLRFLSPVDTAIKYIPKMYKDGAEVIIALTHCGVDVEKELAEKVPAIDVVVGGHSHTRIDPAINVGDHTWVVQTGYYGRAVGKIEMNVNPYNGKIYSFDYKLIDINNDANIAPDPEVQAIADQYNEKIRPLMETYVGKSNDEIVKKIDDGNMDGALGTLICDALRAETEADLAVYNLGGIRIDAIPAGDIKLDTAFRLLPFDDPVVTVKMKGADVLKLMDQMANSKVGPLQTSSNLEAVYDAAAKDFTSLKLNGKDIDPEADYTVSTTEFVSKGGDNYTAFEKGEFLQTTDMTRDIFVQYIKNNKEVNAPAVGRIKIVNK
ncbi:bifunctional metallophosphatase/5'-nucleotidase [bacterium]|nr:bifunctional metallophosphatase/5'-nucleotidase [bacterium]